MNGDGSSLKQGGLKRLCETCTEPATGSIKRGPRVPYNVAYCETCERVDAHPWHILVSKTAEYGGLESVDPEWRRFIENTCTRLGKTVEEFKADVANTKTFSTFEGVPPPAASTTAALPSASITQNDSFPLKVHQ